LYSRIDRLPVAVDLGRLIPKREARIWFPSTLECVQVLASLFRKRHSCRHPFSSANPDTYFNGKPNAQAINAIHFHGSLPHWRRDPEKRFAAKF